MQVYYVSILPSDRENTVYIRNGNVGEGLGSYITSNIWHLYGSDVKIVFSSTQQQKFFQLGKMW